MPSNTVPLGFPYPLGSDPVADGDNAIRGLAESIDDYLMGAVGSISFAPGIANDNSNTALHRRGTSVHLNLVLSINAQLAPDTLLLTLPNGFRPVQPWWTWCRVTGTGLAAVVTVYDDGQVVTRDAVNVNTLLLGSVSYPTA